MSDPKSTIISVVAREILQELAASLRRNVIAVHRANQPRYVALNALSYACALQVIGEKLTDDEAIEGFRSMLTQVRGIVDRGDNPLTLEEIGFVPDAKA